MMKVTTKMLTIMIVAAGLAGAAVAQTSHQSHGTHGGPSARGMAPMGPMMDAGSMQKMMESMMPSANDAPSTKDFKAADMAMMHSREKALFGQPGRGLPPQDDPAPPGRHRHGEGRSPAR